MGLAKPELLAWSELKCERKSEKCYSERAQKLLANMWYLFTFVQLILSVWLHRTEPSGNTLQPYNIKCKLISNLHRTSSSSTVNTNP